MSHGEKSNGALQKLSPDKLIKSIAKHHICWQQLKLPTKKPPEDILAEIVTVVMQQQLHLLYFQLTIEPLSELAAKDLPSACNAYSELLSLVIDKLKSHGKKQRCKHIVSDVFNPHLQQLLKQFEFKIEGQGGNNPIMPSKRMVLAL